ncbi:LOW QUALITY PROTEIN: proline dehydrogenase 1, mitochondrial [Lycodopsis pacificus]
MCTSSRLGRGGRDGTTSTSTSAANEISVDFDQTQGAYKSKDSLELLRSLVVFKLCSYDFLVEKYTEIMDLGKKILGERAFNQFMKMAFYGQFVAAEDHVAIRPLIQKNQAFAVGSVLDYSAEEDISQEEAGKKEMDSCVSAAEEESIGRTTERKKYKAHKQLGDRRGVIGARTYFYGDEAKCDQHMETFIKCIKASGQQKCGSSMDGFSAIKMTALGRPHFLLQFSEVLVKWRQFFTFLASQQGEDSTQALERRLELKQLQEFLTTAKGDLHSWFIGKKEESGTIDMLDWNSPIDDRTTISDLLVVPNVELGELEPLLKTFTSEEEKQMKRMLRVDVLVEEAYDNVTMDVELCLDYVLDEIALTRNANVMVASHNEDTVKHTLKRMNEVGLLARENKVYFGQLLGMCDQSSFPLGQAGFPVYKVPYEPVSEVMSCLSRRAQENRGFMKGALKEREPLGSFSTHQCSDSGSCRKRACEGETKWTSHPFSLSVSHTHSFIVAVIMLAM